MKGDNCSLNKCREEAVGYYKVSPYCCLNLCNIHKGTFECLSKY